jgi:hypothetical protein
VQVNFRGLTSTRIIRKGSDYWIARPKAGDDGCEWDI